MVRESIELSMPDEYWVEAELSECRESRGHCYMELIQKDELSATPVAKASAKCWANKWSDADADLRPLVLGTVAGRAGEHHQPAERL